MARIPGEKEGAFRRGFAGWGVQMFGQPVVPLAVSAEARVRAILWDLSPILWVRSPPRFEHLCADDTEGF